MEIMHVDNTDFEVWYSITFCSMMYPEFILARENYDNLDEFKKVIGEHIHDTSLNHHVLAVADGCRSVMEGQPAIYHDVSLCTGFEDIDVHGSGIVRMAAKALHVTAQEVIALTHAYELNDNYMTLNELKRAIVDRLGCPRWIDNRDFWLTVMESPLHLHDDENEAGSDKPIVCRCNDCMMAAAEY